MPLPCLHQSMSFAGERQRGAARALQRCSLAPEPGHSLAREIRSRWKLRLTPTQTRQQWQQSNLATAGSTSVKSD